MGPSERRALRCMATESPFFNGYEPRCAALLQVALGGDSVGGGDVDVARGLSRRRAGRIRVGVWNEFRLLVIKQVPAARTRGKVPWCVMASSHGGGEIGNSAPSIQGV